MSCSLREEKHMHSSCTYFMHMVVEVVVVVVVVVVAAVRITQNLGLFELTGS